MLPEYPEEARDLDLPPQRCLAVVTLDATGAPTDVAVEGCDAALHPAVQRNLSKWSWYPPVVDGQAGPVRTLVTVRFELK